MYIRNYNAKKEKKNVGNEMTMVCDKSCGALWSKRLVKALLVVGTDRLTAR